MRRRYWTAEHEVLIGRHSAAAGLHRCGLSRRDDCLHPSRDNLLSTKTIAMRGRAWIAAPAGFDYDFKRLLVEMANLDLSLFAVNDGFHAIARDVVAAHLHLRDHLAVEPKIEKRVIEVLLAGG